MRTPVKLGLFGLGLVAIFAVAWGAGTLAGPIRPTTGESTGPSSGHGSRT